MKKILKNCFKDANKILKRDRSFSKGEVLMAGSQMVLGQGWESYSGQVTCPRPQSALDPNQFQPSPLSWGRGSLSRGPNPAGTNPKLSLNAC